MFAMRSLALLTFTAALVVAAVTTTGADNRDSSTLEPDRHGHRCRRCLLARAQGRGQPADGDVPQSRRQPGQACLGRGQGRRAVLHDRGARGPHRPDLRVKRKGAGLEGSTTTGERTIAFVGAHPPSWPAANANATHTYGKPVELFDGKSLDPGTCRWPTARRAGPSSTAR